MSVYTKSQWHEFRNGIIELDGNKCRHCGRKGTEVTLQVHHTKYIKGSLPWESAFEDCITLCSGCHAREHGIIQPQHGWQYCSDEDLEDLVGTCENCGAAIRYVFIIHHEKWGTLEVGTYCCDKLTDSTIASNLMESSKSFKDRKERFLKSRRWKLVEGIYKIRQNLFDIEIKEKESAFYLKIQEQQSHKKYESLPEVKSKAFDVIESGEFLTYLKKKNIPFAQKQKKSTKIKSENGKKD
jgi:hypothetical protein